MFYLRAKQTFFTPNAAYELNLPSDVETRAIDLEKDLPASEFVETLKGIDIVV